MGLALIVISLLFGAAAINGTVSTQGGQTGLGDMLNRDMFGQAGTAGTSGSAGTAASPGVLRWFGAMIVLAAIFKMLHMPGTGKAFAALIILAYFAKNPGIVTQISTEVSGLTSPAAAPAAGGSNPLTAGTGLSGLTSVFGMGGSPSLPAAAAGSSSGNPLTAGTGLSGITSLFGG